MLLPKLVLCLQRMLAEDVPPSDGDVQACCAAIRELLSRMPDMLVSRHLHAAGASPIHVHTHICYNDGCAGVMKNDPHENSREGAYFNRLVPDSTTMAEDVFVVALKLLEVVRLVRAQDGVPLRLGRSWLYLAWSLALEGVTPQSVRDKLLVLLRSGDLIAPGTVPPQSRHWFAGGVVCRHKICTGGTGPPHCRRIAVCSCARIGVCSYWGVLVLQCAPVLVLDCARIAVCSYSSARLFDGTTHPVLLPLLLLQSLEVATSTCMQTADSATWTPRPIPSRTTSSRTRAA
jgi:hypothetical protein